jgi:hypothetical protein
MATDLHTGTEPRLSDLLSGIIRDGQELVSQQLALFKREVQEDTRKTQQVLAGLLGGAAIVLVGGLLLGHSCAHALAAGLHWPLWGSYLGMGLVVTTVGAVLTGWAYRQFQAFNPLPDKTMAALQENLAWKTQPTPSASK